MFQPSLWYTPCNPLSETLICSVQKCFTLKSLQLLKEHVLGGGD